MEGGSRQTPQISLGYERKGKRGMPTQDLGEQDGCWPSWPPRYLVFLGLAYLCRLKVWRGFSFCPKQT